MKKITFVLLAIIFSCQHPPEKKLLIHETGGALGTTFSIQYESKESYSKEIQEIFNRVNQSMSTYLPDSDISKINFNRGNVLADSLLVNVFNASVDVWKKTDSLFDPTVGPLINAYGFGPEKRYNHLSSEVIDSLLEFVGLHKIKIENSGKVLKNDSRIYLDFNAIAKGYTVDLIGLMFNRKGIDNYLIELGGEILAKGINPDKKQVWTVAIDHPQQTEERTLIKTLQLNNRAMATSGNYRKFYTDSLTGEKYVHTINPKTGKPQKNNILSVTVLAENCMKADAYATAFMLMPQKASVSLSKKESMDVFFVFLNDEGNIQTYATSGFDKTLIK